MTEQTVVIATFDNNFEADLAKSLLEENGIEAIVLNELVNSIYSTFANTMIKLELAVSLDQAGQAKAILDTYTDGFYTHKLLQESGALLEGHFLLTSGQHSNRYIEKIRILQSPVQTEAVCNLLADRLRGYDFDVVAGPAYGGIVLAFEVARLLDKPFLFTQRKDEVMTVRSGFDLSGFKSAAVVEDIVTTGGSVLEVIACLKQLNIEPVAVACLVDRSGGKVELNCPFLPLLTLAIPAWEPDACEQCKQGVPLVKPGRSDKPN